MFYVRQIFLADETNPTNVDIDSSTIRWGFWMLCVSFFFNIVVVIVSCSGSRQPRYLQLRQAIALTFHAVFARTLEGEIISKKWTKNRPKASKEAPVQFEATATNLQNISSSPAGSPYYEPGCDSFEPTLQQFRTNF